MSKPKLMIRRREVVTGGVSLAAMVCGFDNRCLGQSTSNPPFGVNVRDFGAVGDGHQDDTIALQAAVDYAARKKVPAVLIPRSKEFYRITSPVICRSGVSIMGSEQGVRIKNTRSNYNFGLSQVFRLGNFHPSFTEAFQPIPLVPSVRGSQIVRTVQSGVLLKKGETIVIMSSERTPVANLSIPAKMEINIVSDAGSGLVKLAFPIHESDLTLLVRLRDGYLGRDHIPLFVYANASIQNLDIETDGYWTADTAMLNVNVENVSVRSRAAIYGNSVQRSSYKNIYGTYSTAAVEQGHNSILNSYQNIHVSYEGVSSPRGTICVSIQENATDLKFKGGSIGVADGLKYFPLVIMNAARIEVQKIKFVGGELENAAIYLGGRQDIHERPCEDNSIRHCEFFFKSLSAAVDVENTGIPGQVRNNEVLDCRFSGLSGSNAVRVKGATAPRFERNQFL